MSMTPIQQQALTIIERLLPTDEFKPYATWLLPSRVMTHCEIESAWDAGVLSTDGLGSRGLMQVLPSTAAGLGISGSQTQPDISIKSGMAYLVSCYKTLKHYRDNPSTKSLSVSGDQVPINCPALYTGDDVAYSLICAAYNEGPGNVLKGHLDPAYVNRFNKVCPEWAYVDAQLGVTPPTPVVAAPEPVIVVAPPAPTGTALATAVLADAVSMIGCTVVNAHARLVSYLRSGGVEIDPAEIEWCAAFVDATLARHGVKGRTLVANSFEGWGSLVEGDPLPGDVADITRGLGQVPGGHVGFATGTVKPGEMEIVAGNTRTEGTHGVVRYFVPRNTVMVRRAPDEPGEIHAPAPPAPVPPVTAVDGQAEVDSWKVSAPVPAKPQAKQPVEDPDDDAARQLDAEELAREAKDPAIQAALAAARAVGAGVGA